MSRIDKISKNDAEQHRITFLLTCLSPLVMLVSFASMA